MEMYDAWVICLNFFSRKYLAKEIIITSYDKTSHNFFEIIFFEIPMSSGHKRVKIINVPKKNIFN